MNRFLSPLTRGFQSEWQIAVSAFFDQNAGIWSRIVHWLPDGTLPAMTVFYTIDYTVRREIKLWKSLRRASPAQIQHMMMTTTCWPATWLVGWSLGWMVGRLFGVLDWGSLVGLELLGGTTWELEIQLGHTLRDWSQVHTLTLIGKDEFARGRILAGFGKRLIWSPTRAPFLRHITVIGTSQWDGILRWIVFMVEA